MRPFDRAAASRALARWGGNPATLRHLATSGNAVFRYTHDGAPRVLRLTDPAYRSPAHNRAEMAFLRHLDACGVAVNVPIASDSGKDVEELDGACACVLSWAPGQRVAPGSPHWGEAFMHAWGEHLGRLHQAARAYRGPARWAWHEDVFLREGGALIPDAAARERFGAVMDTVAGLPKTSDNYGMVHQDLGPQNFHYAPELGVTSFDFGNACRHWFAADLAISLSTLARLPEREALARWLLDGYRTVAPTDDATWQRLPLFVALRAHYVYLSRLLYFDRFPDKGDPGVLDHLRQRALDADGAAWVDGLLAAEAR